MSKIHIFQTWTPNSCYIKGVFAKKIWLHLPLQFFWDQSWPSQTSPSPFFAFFFSFSPLLKQLFSLFVRFQIFGELRKLRTKFFICWMKLGREIIFQTWLHCDCFKHTNFHNFGIDSLLILFQFYVLFIRYLTKPADFLAIWHLTISSASSWNGAWQATDKPKI